MPTTLAELAAALPGATVYTAVDASTVVLTDATHDSRQVEGGWLFCAVPGANVDGHDHAAGALGQGAAALLVERVLDLDVPQVVVPSVRAAMGPAAAVVHGDPSAALTVVGVTGTNGKTTVTYLLEGAFAAAGIGTGVIGTVETRIHGVTVPGVRTTPEGPDLQRLLRRCHERGVDAVAAEVSSHGLDLRRVDGTRFDVAVYTNLSRDHLDWHGSMEAYLAAKARLFTPALAAQGVVFLDGPWAGSLLEQATIRVTTVGWARQSDTGGAAAAASTRGGPAPDIAPEPDIALEVVRDDLDGGTVRLHGLEGGPWEVSTTLPGGHNLGNAALAVVAAVRSGIPAEAAAAGVAAAPGVPGRLERVTGGSGPTVFVDYAHTPDAVTTVLSTLRAATGSRGRVLVVLGCGGERDREKRGPMGAAACAADVAVLTSDNPRSEDPDAILAAVAAGAREAVAAGAAAEVIIDRDRRRAIARAISLAGADDVVLIAGKGHETSQEFAGHSLPFDDRLVAAEFLAGGEVVG